MFWTVFGIAAVIVLIFAVTLYYICRRLFDMALVRGSDVVIGGDGFEKQLAEYKDEWEKGKALFDTLEKEDVWMESFDSLKLHGVYKKRGRQKGYYRGTRLSLKRKA